MTTKDQSPTEYQPLLLGSGFRRLLDQLGRIPGLRRTVRVTGIMISRLSKDDGWAMASHLTLSALMALFPFLIFVGGIASIFFGDAHLAQESVELIFETWPPDVAGPIQREIINVLSGPRTGVITISVLITLYLAMNGVEAVRAALTRAYGSEQQRTFLMTKVQSLGFVLLGTLACIALALLGVLGPLLFELLVRWFPDLEGQGGLFTFFRYLIVGTLLTAVLTAAHLWLPGRRWQGIRIWPGIIATLILWWLATVAFAAYLKGFANYVSTYAGLAGIVTALFYLYIMSVILLIGAELNAAISRTSPRASRGRTLKKKKRLPLVPPRPPSVEEPALT